MRRRIVSEGMQRPEATVAAGTDPHNVLYTHTNKKNICFAKPLKHTLKGTSQNSIELEREFTTDKHSTE